MAEKPNALQSPYLTLREVAKYFRVDESTIRKGCGVFRLLQLATTELEPGKRRGRTLVLRESVERVDSLLKQRAAAGGSSVRLVKTA